LADDLVESLKRFVPKDVPRDAILFQAGMAAGRNARPWQWVSALLAVVCFVLLLLLLSGREPLPISETAPAELPEPSVESAPLPLEPYSLMTLMQRGELPPAQGTERDLPATTAKPLRSGTRIDDDSF